MGQMGLGRERERMEAISKLSTEQWGKRSRITTQHTHQQFAAATHNPFLFFCAQITGNKNYQNVQQRERIDTIIS